MDIAFRRQLAASSRARGGVTASLGGGRLGPAQLAGRRSISRSRSRGIENTTSSV